MLCANPAVPSGPRGASAVLALPADGTHRDHHQNSHAARAPRGEAAAAPGGREPPLHEHGYQHRAL
eukprot:8226075-Lingulodinium_polyedra.AAC.1